MRPFSSGLVLVVVTAMSACPAPSADQEAQQAGAAAQRAVAAAEAQATPVDDKDAKLTAELRAKASQFAAVELSADITGLPESEQEVLHKLIAAARLMDPLFERQAWAGNPALHNSLKGDSTALGITSLAYFEIMRGPWDRQDHFKPFATKIPHPPGAGFYPEDLTADHFKQWVSEHPEDREAFNSLTTIIERTSIGLRAVPYSEAYGEWLRPAAVLLEEAAELTTNASLKRFLRSRAAAFRSDDYYQSDKDWMDLDSPVEITIGPYETYEDELLGLKASFEAFVTVADAKASADLMRFKGFLPDMEANLPVPNVVKTKRGSDSPIRVVDLVYSAGDARKSVQTIAFNLPNDERVRAEKGAKKVLLRNLIATKFNVIMRPIGAKVLAATHVGDLDDHAFFLEVLFHELSHSLGPAFTMRDGASVEVREALETTYSPLEEAKADVMGAYNVLYMIDRGEITDLSRAKLLISYFAGLFRSVRFGVAEAHGKGAALQINRIIESGAATPDPSTGKFVVDLAKLEAEISKLVHDLCMLQHNGDRAGAEALLAKYGQVSPAMTRVLDQLTEIPIDIRPSYPLAGEVLIQ